MHQTTGKNVTPLAGTASYSKARIVDPNQFSCISIISVVTAEKKPIIQVTIFPDNTRGHPRTGLLAFRAPVKPSG